jgi:hypothetical protein
MPSDLRRSGTLAGVGALAFAVLTFVGLFVASPPGGSYGLSEATNYVKGGHRATGWASPPPPCCRRGCAG